MKSAYNKVYCLIAVVAMIDMATVNIGYFTYYFADRWLEFDPQLFTHDFLYWFLFNISYFISINVMSISAHKRLTEPQEELKNVSRTIPLSLLIFMTLASMAKIPTPGFIKAVLLCFAAFMLISVERMIVRKAVKHVRHLGKYNLRSIIIGYGPSTNDIVDVLNDRWNGLNLMGIFTDGELDEDAVGAKRLGGVDDAVEYIKSHSLHDVFIYRPLYDDERMKIVLNICYQNVLRVYYMPDMMVGRTSYVYPYRFGDTYILATRHEPLLKMRNRCYKRIFDVSVSLLFLCTIYPIVYAIVAIVTKLTSAGPIYFKQERTGYDGRPFICYKFRSMDINDDADRKQATKDDDRVTKFGYFIRHYNIDELPQFINVLKGDMSIVGPRPHMVAHTEYYGKIISEYMIRHLVRPGITGLAQVSGCRGETKTVDDMRKRVEKDIEYIESWGFWQDIVIIMHTVLMVIKGDKQAY